MMIWREFQLILCLYLVAYSNSCSMLTHIEVATRASAYFSFNGFEQFKPLIQKHLATYQAGATFPDWGYPRNGYHQASEMAHWPPFYLAAAEYIQKTYPQPWSEDAEKLVVFLAGATTHMVADVAWHSLLNVTQGFIVSMACFGWSCDYDAAHPTADLGGDTVLAVQNDLSYILTNWSIPIRDIAEIYKMQGWRNVTELVLTESITELYVGTMALLDGGAEVLYPKYNKIPGFLQDQFEDYFIGGLDDMAVWTTYCWPYVLGWFVNGPGPSPTICRLMEPAMPTDFIPSAVHVPEWRFSRFPDELLEEKAKVMKRVAAISMGGQTELSWSSPRPTITNNKFSSGEAVQAEKRTTIYSQVDYAYFGYEVVSADLNQDKLVDLIVTAPGYSNATLGKPQMGCAYFLFGSSTRTWPQTVDIESIADYKLCGNSSHDRFGHAVQVIDFNKDGVLDVAIGSPTTNSEHLGYQGRVNVFLGTLTGNQWHTSSEANVSLFGSMYANFGFTIISGDVNLDGYDDLIVGSPFAPRLMMNETGNVAIFFSSPSNIAGKALSVSQANIFLNAPIQYSLGVEDHGWWGSTLLFVAGPSYKFPYLVVGGERNIWLNRTSFLPECGSFSIYLLDGAHYDRPLAVFYGNAYERVGAQLALGSIATSPVLAVSIPLIDTIVPQAGKVVFLPFSSLLSFIDKWSANSTDWILPFAELAPLITTSINGNQVFARFGSELAFVDYVAGNQPVVETLFIGYPLWTFNTTEEGCVCRWETARFPHGEINDPILSASRVYTSSVTEGLVMQKDARFGNVLDFGDMDGDGNTDIFIGSTRKSLFSYLGGALEIIFSS